MPLSTGGDPRDSFHLTMAKFRLGVRPQHSHIPCFIQPASLLFFSPLILNERDKHQIMNPKCLLITQGPSRKRNCYYLNQEQKIPHFQISSLEYCLCCLGLGLSVPLKVPIDFKVFPMHNFIRPSILSYINTP